MEEYVVRAITAPDKRIVNKEHSHGEDKEGAMRHFTRLKKQGWRAEIILRVKEVVQNGK